MERVYGWAEQGNQTVLTNGVPSQNNTLVQRSFPGATITVYNTGTNNTANLYSDNNGTPLANPFTASNSGYWDFYVAAGRYDIQFSGNNAGISSPFTLADVLVSAIQTINGQGGENINIVANNNGNNFNISASNNNVIITLPQANANNSGYLAAADWANFNNKSAGLNFAAPLVNNNGNVTLTAPLTIAQGGTNGTNATTAFDNLAPITTKGDLIVGNNNNVAVRLPAGNNSYVLTSNNAANNGVDWEQVSLTAGVTGVLPIANGGSNGNNATQGFTNLSPITTKGDLIVGNNTNIPVRLPVGNNGQLLTADATQTNGLSWQNFNIGGNGVSGVLPVTAGGTGGNNNSQAFTLLSPMNSNGDLITYSGGATRLAIGANNAVLTAGNNAVSWKQPAYLSANFAVSFNNNAFVANTNSVTVALFTLTQYQKVAGVTVKAANLFLNNNNTITDVNVQIGVGGNANLFSNAYSVGNNGAVGNANFQDTAVFKSANMGGNQIVLATFTANNGNFGNGANTVLTSGNLTVWVTVVNLQ